MRVHMTDPVVALTKLLATVLAEPRFHLRVDFTVTFNTLFELVLVAATDHKRALATAPLELGRARR